MKVCGKKIKMQGQLIRIARVDGDKYVALDDPAGMIAGLRGANFRADIFTFMQTLADTSPKYSYHMEWDNLSVLPISTFAHWWEKQVDGKTRNVVRKAEKKGVEVRQVPFDDAFIQGISDIYNETPIRQGKRFPHYRKTIDEVRNEEGTFVDTAVFLGAFFESTLIGFVKLVPDMTGTQAGLMNIISMVHHRDKAPTNALIAESVSACARLGIRNLVYSNFAYGKKQRDSLADFKLNSGFGRIDVPRYYVPLSALGSLALMLGLHHNLADRLPESLLMKLRHYRSAWNSRRFPPLLGTS